MNVTDVWHSTCTHKPDSPGVCLVFRTNKHPGQCRADRKSPHAQLASVMWCVSHGAREAWSSTAARRAHVDASTLRHTASFVHPRPERTYDDFLLCSRTNLRYLPQCFMLRRCESTTKTAVSTEGRMCEPAEGTEESKQSYARTL